MKFPSPLGASVARVQRSMFTHGLVHENYVKLLTCIREPYVWKDVTFLCRGGVTRCEST